MDNIKEVNKASWVGDKFFVLNILEFRATDKVQKKER